MSRLGTHMRMMILRSPAAPVSDCEKAPVPPYGLVSSPRTWAARRLEALSIALPTSRASTGPTLRGRVRAPATDVCAAENPETSTSPRRSTAAASRREADGMASPTGSPTSRSAEGLSRRRRPSLDFPCCFRRYPWPWRCSSQPCQRPASAQRAWPFGCHSHARKRHVAVRRPCHHQSSLRHQPHRHRQSRLHSAPSPLAGREKVNSQTRMRCRFRFGS